MKKMFKLIAAVAIVSLWIPSAFAGDSETFNISATINSMSQLNVDISRIDLPGETWNPGQASVNFGTLAWDSVNNIFTANNYYAVDVGIIHNLGSWTVQHSSTSLTNGTDDLDNNVNVIFMNQASSTTGTQLDKLSYASADGQSYTNSDITGWLRIYYGIATGSGDATGVVPIGVAKSTGTYTGAITLTVTP